MKCGGESEVKRDGMHRIVDGNARAEQVRTMVIAAGILGVAVVINRQRGSPADWQTTSRSRCCR